MFLIEPSIEYDKQIQAFREEFLACEGSMDGRGRQYTGSMNR